MIAHFANRSDIGLPVFARLPLGAWALHRLGARALAAQGAGQEARAAEAAAARAWDDTLAKLPEDRREAYRRANTMETVR